VYHLFETREKVVHVPRPIHVVALLMSACAPHPVHLTTERPVAVRDDLALRPRGGDDGGVLSQPGVETTPFSVGAARAIDEAVLAAMTESKMPGCVVVLGRKDTVLFARAYGYRALEPVREPTTIDTVYDLASLTKPIATAMSVMVLVDQERVALDDPVSKYVAELASGGNDAVTVRELLTHTSGLAVETPYADYALGIDEAIRKIASFPRKSVPGAQYRYSDIGFIVLGELVRRVSGESLDVFAREHVFAPLGMRDTGFLPPPPLQARAALTEPREGVWMRGVVHDPRAYLLGGVSGHAGLFSTAQDLAIFAQAILGEGEHAGKRVLSASTLRAMLAPHDVPGGIRALGWDVKSAYSANRGESLSPRAVGHGGYTGTSLWIDPGKDLFVLFLSNRVHPDGKGAINPLAGRIADLAVGGLLPESAGKACDAPPCPLETGIDVLVSEGFASLRGAHVGLITNATGHSRSGARDIDLLRSAAGVALVAVFAPEHGLTSDRDERIADARDEATGLPIYSLYGDGFEPTPASLEGLDTLVFDVQDAGSRFYTYGSTMKRALEVAAAENLRFVVLDRPDPIDGIDVAGPVLAGFVPSFVNYHALPVRHGMTMGELALLFDADLHLGARLDVVPMSGWQRASYFDETGLAWTNPSPNLRSVTEALLYDGVGLLEGTNLAVGRGTDSPFEVVGAPWIDGAALADAMARAGVPGAAFTKVSFTPASSTYGGQACSGVRIAVNDRRLLDPLRLGVEIALAIHRLYPSEWHVRDLEKMIADPGIVAAIAAGEPFARIEARWADGLLRFKAKREKYLLYR
jgi:uncharacterized protein YbbC (DUF1343 family)